MTENWTETDKLCEVHIYYSVSENIWYSFPFYCFAKSIMIKKIELLGQNNLEKNLFLSQCSPVCICPVRLTNVWAPGCDLASARRCCQTFISVFWKRIMESWVSPETAEFSQWEKIKDTSALCFVMVLRQKEQRKKLVPSFSQLNPTVKSALILLKKKKTLTL